MRALYWFYSIYFFFPNFVYVVIEETVFELHNIKLKGHKYEYQKASGESRLVSSIKLSTQIPTHIQTVTIGYIWHVVRSCLSH